MVQPATTSPALHNFHIDVSQEALDDLRQRVAATRWPDRETVNDRSQAVHFAAWEQPELFSEEVRAAFRSLR